ncbi:MAG: hypothetical protein LCH61_07960 [Proteobacteria bacterium]|nr:hypothetical protein [Pseudomonadota bacterium]
MKRRCIRDQKAVSPVQGWRFDDAADGRAGRVKDEHGSSGPGRRAHPALTQRGIGCNTLIRHRITLRKTDAEALRQQPDIGCLPNKTVGNQHPMWRFSDLRTPALSRGKNLWRDPVRDQKGNVRGKEYARFRGG